MSTPTSLKQMEQARQRAAARRNAAETAGMGTMDELGSAGGRLMPLSATANISNWNFRHPRFQVSRNRPKMDFTDDHAGGRQYTSFESAPKNTPASKDDAKKPNRGPAKPLTPPKVLDVPLDVDTDDYSIDPSSVVCFNGRQHFLSNLFPSPMHIEGHSYPSVEHYYQACKLYTLGGARLAMQIRRIPDSGNVKVAARRLLRGVVDEEEIETWKREQAPVILHHALVHKFVQNAYLREQLLNTKQALLAHTYTGDNFFATACDRDQLVEWATANNGQIIKIPSTITPETLPYVPLVGQGKNVLGAINMKVRDELRAFQAKNETSDPIMLAAMQALKLSGVGVASGGGDGDEAPSG